MRETIVNKYNHTVGRIKGCFIDLEIRFRFHGLSSMENMACAEKNWKRFYEQASKHVAPIELVDCDSAGSEFSDFEELISPMVDERCYCALCSALIQCLRIEIVNNENACYGIIDGIDKLNSACYNLGRAELYAELEIERGSNSTRASKGGVARNEKNNENRELLSKKLKEQINDLKNKGEKMNQSEFIEKVFASMYGYATEKRMKYSEGNFDRILLDILKEDLYDLFRAHVYKR